MIKINKKIVTLEDAIKELNVLKNRVELLESRVSKSEFRSRNTLNRIKNTEYSTQCQPTVVKKS